MGGDLTSTPPTDLLLEAIEEDYIMLTFFITAAAFGFGGFKLREYLENAYN